MESFSSRIRGSLRTGGLKPPVSVQDNLLTGMYVIMRKLKGYTHFDFLRDDFMGSQYFLLVDFINQEMKESEKASKKAKK